jgi:hypothetical protein
VANSARPALTPQALVELAERVERLCREHGRDGQLAALLEEAGAADLLDEAVALVISADYDPRRMREALDRIERELAAQGIHNLTRTDRVFSPLPSVQPPGQPPSGYVCPLSRCTRGQATQGRCALADRRLEQLPLGGAGLGRP